MHPRDNRIKIEDCQHGKLYKLSARNIKIGVWNDKSKSFIGIRTKFGNKFLDDENHYDDLKFATASPLEIIGELPADIVLEENYYNDGLLFQWLELKEKELGIYDEE